jgi:shikimate kinase
VDGEPHFRLIELETLRGVLNRQAGVISLGGGAPISEQAQSEIKNSESHVVFLDVSLATAAPRVGFNRDRPLLLGNPRGQWQALSDKRRPIYENLASDCIKVDDMSVDQIVAEIKKKLA